jgi:competence ComEA-like helix-hairpin-helix protein
VPGLEPARALLWLAVALLALHAARAPGDLPRLQARRGASGACALSALPDAPPCACSELPGDLRRVLGLPLPLADASAAELEGLPGIGPRRARAIVEERERRPFASTAELRRVRGIGEVTARRLGAQLFVGPDPACASRRIGSHS